ncbi:Site-specific DNA recombinase [Ruaniaceae bacterium KH17]|nr:Site-specific DNA recombinase [Ruaniaceae bacterium KH17]
MTITQPADTDVLGGIGETTTLAVSYLRVSTKEQASKGGRDEGFSIPAQREANLRKARDLNAIIVEEFVDAGESARKADRPDLVRMIEYVKANQIAYCIVHKVDRLARNRADDVSIHLALKDAGVMLVSATENIDETPSGMLLHGIMSTIAEFYSRNLASEVAKGMNQKARTGGTNGKAPIGYLNVTKRDDLGREMRIVEPDPERAALVKWAFEAYATGNYSTITLREELIDRGLTTVPTPKRPAKPPALSTIQRMLSSPYYKGNVCFRGATYDGIHEPLVATEVWYRVQAVLTAHQTSGEKTQAHDHYLKGSVYCGECGSRLILTNAKSRRGVIYPYFICSGRHSKRTSCERKAMYVPDIEAAVEDYYRSIQIAPHIISALRELITAEFDRLHATARHERQAYQHERDELLAERKKLLQAHYAGAIPLDLLSEEQERIARRLAFLEAQIEAGDIEYGQAQAHIEDCLALAGDCHAIYMSIDDSLRRIANQAFFDKLIVMPEDGIIGEPGEPFDALFNPDVQTRAVHFTERTAESGPQTVDVGGLNNDVLVGPEGLDPLLPAVGSQRGPTEGYRPNCVYGIRGLPSIRKGKVGVYMLWEHVGWLLPGILLVVVYVIPSS